MQPGKRSNEGKGIRLWLVRHGATAWNASLRFQGHSDVELSEEGRVQARSVAARLSSEPIDRIYSSDLSRAFETAQIVAQPHHLAVQTDTRLREFAFGAWEGLTWAEIVATRPHLREAERTKATVYAPEGGETFAAVCARVRAFFDDISQMPGGDVAVVTHAGPLHATLAVLELTAKDPTEHDAGVRFAAASLTQLAMERGQARLITLGDVRHLDSAG